MTNKQERYEDFPGDPQGIDLGKSRKNCMIFFLTATFMNLFIIVNAYVSIPFLVSLIMANFYFHRANPKLNFTQKVVVEIVGFSIANLPNVILTYLFVLSS